MAVSLLGEVLRQYKAICTADPGPKWKPGNDIVAELVGDVKVWHLNVAWSGGSPR